MWPMAALPRIEQRGYSMTDQLKPEIDEVRQGARRRPWRALHARHRHCVGRRGVRDRRHFHYAADSGAKRAG